MHVNSIKEKKILITGASQGIGASISTIFAENGALIGLHYNESEDQVKKLKTKIGKNTGKVKLYKYDLLKCEKTADLISSFIRDFGGIDVLINNAGACFGYRHFSDLDEISWDKTLILNAKAPFYLSSYAFEYMKDHGGGRIINISSASVRRGSGPNGMHYTASKAALDSLTLGFSRAGADHNILVNSIRCGVIDTNMHTRIEGYSKDQFEKRINMIPLKRVGKPNDIASMALYLASEGGDFITGEIFTIAGGD
jgi:3-oxoacyl-[acyl-carrier protein] reductase